MALTTILHIIVLLRALAAAASDSIKPFTLSKMGPSDQDLYLSAFSSRLNRHGSRSSFSGAPSAVRTGAATTSTMMTGEKAEMIVSQLILQMLWALMKYSLYAFLMWSAICFLPWRRMLWAFGEWAEATAREIAPQIRAGLRGWFDMFVLLLIHIFRAAAQNRWVVHARCAIGDWFVRTRQAVVHLIDDIRHHRILDAIYMHYQLIVNWLGRHKLHMIVLLVGIHFFSPATANQNDKTTEVFMKWGDIQRYIDTPLPEYLVRQPLEDGSNSHYHREARWWPGNTNENHLAEPGLIEPISVELIAPVPVEEAIAQLGGVDRTESEQEATGLAVDISTPPSTTPGLADRISVSQTLTMLLEEDTSSSTTIVYETEKRQKLPGGRVAYCRQCRQEHCCEVYI